MQISKDEVLKIIENIKARVELNQNFVRLQEILEKLKNEENIYLVNIYKIIFLTTKESMLADPTEKAILPFNHFSDMFLKSFSDRIV